MLEAKAAKPGEGRRTIKAPVKKTTVKVAAKKPAVKKATANKLKKAA